MRLTLRVLSICALLVAGWPEARAQSHAPEPLPSDSEPLPSTMHCPVEGHEVTDRRHGVLYKGRRYYLGTEVCQEKFLEDPELYAKAIEPRSALFRSQNPSAPSMAPSMLALSVLFVLGLLSGGLASYLAVQKGYAGVPWFAYGVVFNVLAVIAIARKEDQPLAFRREGLAKMPSTHAPTPCPSCGRENHPSARRCSRCDAAIEPTVQADAARI